MNLRKLFYAALMTAAAIACKKDDDASSYPTLDGSLAITGVQRYITAGETVKMTPKGLSHPENKIIGYYWKVSPLMDKYDTTRYTNGLDKNGVPADGSFTYTFPTSADSLSTYTIYCYAFSKGYTGTTATAYTTAVKGGADGSIQGITFPEEKISTADAEYFYGNIGSQTWTLNNIAETQTGISYDNIPVMTDVFGRYYNHEDAIAACAGLPGGEWKLPSIEDWNTLESYIAGQLETEWTGVKSIAAALMVNATFNGEVMWEYWPAVGDITNSSGFSALPTGYANISSGSFADTGRYAAFWTETSVADVPELAYCKYLICDQPEIFTDKVDKQSFGASVRCIKK